MIMNEQFFTILRIMVVNCVSMQDFHLKFLHKIWVIIKSPLRFSILTKSSIKQYQGHDSNIHLMEYSKNFQSTTVTTIQKHHQRKSYPMPNCIFNLSNENSMIKIKARFSAHKFKQIQGFNSLPSFSLRDQTSRQRSEPLLTTEVRKGSEQNAEESVSVGSKFNHEPCRRILNNELTQLKRQLEDLKIANISLSIDNKIMRMALQNPQPQSLSSIKLDQSGSPSLGKNKIRMDIFQQLKLQKQKRPQDQNDQIKSARQVASSQTNKNKISFLSISRLPDQGSGYRESCIKTMISPCRQAKNLKELQAKNIYRDQSKQHSASSHLLQNKPPNKVNFLSQHEPRKIAPRQANNNAQIKILLGKLSSFLGKFPQNQ